MVAPADHGERHHNKSESLLTDDQFHAITNILNFVRTVGKFSNDGIRLAAQQTVHCIHLFDEYSALMNADIFSDDHNSPNTVSSPENESQISHGSHTMELRVPNKAHVVEMLARTEMQMEVISQYLEDCESLRALVDSALASARQSADRLKNAESVADDLVENLLEAYQEMKGRYDVLRNTNIYLLPATEQAIAGLVRRVLTEDDVKKDDDATCQICTEVQQVGETISNLLCQHAFHEQCLDKWLIDGCATCPTCRTPVLSEHETNKKWVEAEIHKVATMAGYERKSGAGDEDADNAELAEDTGMGENDVSQEHIIRERRVTEVLDDDGPIPALENSTGGDQS